MKYILSPIFRLVWLLIVLSILSIFGIALLLWYFRTTEAVDMWGEWLYDQQTFAPWAKFEYDSIFHYTSGAHNKSRNVTH